MILLLLIGLGLLAVVLAIALVVAIVGISGLLVKFMLGFDTLRRSLAARVLEQRQGGGNFEGHSFFILRSGRADILTIFIDRSGLVSDYSFSKGVAASDLYRQQMIPQ